MKIDSNKIVLKRATISDIETLIENRIIFLKEIQGNSDKEKEVVLRNSLKEYFNRSLKNESFISWIAEYENKPIGFSGMVIREQPGNFEIPCGMTGYILNMFILKGYRGNGIGTLLFQKLIDESRQLNLDRLDLHATKEGEPLYRRYGFIEPHEKVLEHVVKKN